MRYVCFRLPVNLLSVSGLQEYKVSSFEQRLISEIEFRLERSPVEESDDDVQHDEESAAKGVAPSFDQKLKHYKVFEGMPVTFSCKVMGDPKPKVGACTEHVIAWDEIINIR